MRAMTMPRTCIRIGLLLPRQLPGYNTSAPFICSRDATGSDHQLRRSRRSIRRWMLFESRHSLFLQGASEAAAPTGKHASGEHDSDVYYAWGNLAEAYYWTPGSARGGRNYRHAIALGRNAWR